MLAVDRDQALAFRVAGHNLHRRTDPLAAVAACGLLAYPPGWVEVALHARSKRAPDPADVMTVNAMRGSPHLIPRRDAAVFTLALMPEGENLRTIFSSRTAREVEAAGFTQREALNLVADAAREGLSRGPMGRDDFHQMFREKLPESLLPWCPSCRSHHVRPGLWRTLGRMGVTEMPARATFALARPGKMPLAEARAELARRFLRCFGPASASQLGDWAQTPAAHAKGLLGQIEDELTEVRLDGRRRFVLAEDLRRLERPPRARGTRMLSGYDPYLGQPDRGTLVGDGALRKRMFPAVGRPGGILVDGELRGLWRSRKKGTTLCVEIDWLGEGVDVTRELRAIAPLRGCENAELE